ncbi:MAG TPA: alpha-D-ribose 1-methylphosphonate 5-triphosphate diphosphatase [Devosiaceae bacterium]|jgi:alpha-D-ribose 1-methylphosphonate 5-triphosphate diphosphatase
MPTPTEQVLSNARIVLPDTILDGALVLRDGLIADIDETAMGGEDCEGDYLLPGFIELHTDHLENHFIPRPGVRWNVMAAVQAHDAQVASSGITTVFDALRVGTDEQSDFVHADVRMLADAIEAGVADDRLRADHFIHLRCEVSSPDCLEGFDLFKDDTRVRLASLMDHAPGQRQFASMDHYRAYYQGKLKMNDQVFAEFSARRIRESETYSAKQRQAIVDVAQSHGIVLATHDDATVDHVAEAARQGIRIAEFPTTIPAAEASREVGMAVLMGAPNVVRGGSHSGNVSARALAEAGLLDILSSDYVPFSLMQAVFTLPETVKGIGLPQAVAMVSAHPAAAASLTDRGEIAIGKRADLVRVTLQNGVPIVRAVYRQGRRVI